jgi:thymidylate kinase
MENRNLLIFEGLPGAGKTTLSRLLSKEYGCHRIGEIISSNFREVDYRDLENATNKFFLESDERKYKIARCEISQNHTCLMDRGVISTLAYAYVRSSFFQDDTYRVTKEWFDKRKDLFGIPSVYIFLEVDPKCCNLRKHKSEDERDLWSFYDNLVMTCRFYEDFFASQDVSYVRINASAPIEEVINLTRSTIKEIIGE